MTSKYNGKVRFVTEDWDQSEQAIKFGIKRYPVIFVDDVLVAQPDDFGGWGKNDGRYAPIADPKSRERFKSDVSRVVDLLLAGKGDEATKLGSKPSDVSRAREFPAAVLTDIHGKPIDRASLSGKAVVVEFWATWCPPCIESLKWLEAAKKKYGDKLQVVAIAMSSERKDVEAFIKTRGLTARVVMGTPEIAAQFGEFTSVPAMFIFNGSGQLAGTFYGAPPNLHQQVGSVLDRLAGGRS